MGVLDLRGALGRWFGGIGTAAPVPPLRLWAEPARRGALLVSGDDSPRAQAFAERFLVSQRHDGGVRLHVEHALPRHVGLGSGTQLALGVARAIAEVCGLESGVTHLAEGTGRTRRSGVGMWVFDGGGLVLEGGRRGSRIPPLLARLPFPTSWRIVVAIPPPTGGVHGQDEEDLFARLVPPPLEEAQQVAHLVLMGLLPSLAEEDFASFTSALHAVQRTTGTWFADPQGGPFGRHAQPLVDAFLALGGQGVGQSSWGPCTYAFAEDDASAIRLAHAMRHHVGAEVDVYVGPCRAEGARVWCDDERSAPTARDVYSQALGGSMARKKDVITEAATAVGRAIGTAAGTIDSLTQQGKALVAEASKRADEGQSLVKTLRKTAAKRTKAAVKQTKKVAATAKKRVAAARKRTTKLVSKASVKKVKKAVTRVVAKAKKTARKTARKAARARR
jgi:beta-RFAP synthase